MTDTPSTPGDDDVVMPEAPPVADDADSGKDASGVPDAAATTDGDEPSSSASSRKPLIIAGAVAAVVVVVIAVVLLTRPADPTYDDASRTRFLNSCTAGGGDATRSACECLYDGIVETVPYDRFEVVSEELALQDSKKAPDEPLDLPDDMQAILDTCLQ